MFYLKEYNKVALEWSNYKPELYKRVEANILKLIAGNLASLIFENVNSEKLSDEEDIKKSIKYWCNQLIRNCIIDTVGKLKNNELKGLSNRSYIHNYDMLNNMCEKVFYQLTIK